MKHYLLFVFIGLSPVQIHAQYTGGSGKGDGADVFRGTHNGPQVATQIAFINTPVLVTGNFNVQIEIQDALGNRAAFSNEANASVSLAIDNNPSAAILGGTTPINAFEGLATFSNMFIDQCGSGYTLRASSGSFTDVISSAFDVFQMFSGGAGKGDAREIVAENVYLTDKLFTGNINADFSLGANWVGGTFPNNEVGIVSLSATQQPVLIGAQTINQDTWINITQGAKLSIAPPGVLTVNGVVRGEGKLIIQSNASGTASIGASTGSISVQAEVERYIPTVAVEDAAGRRAYRLLTMPLVGATNNSVFATWQNNGAVIAGQGMEIWGPNGTGAEGNGLAVGPFHSLAKYPTSLPATGWVNITNTKTEPLFDADRNYGFLAFPTGPYGSNIISGFDNAQPTTLRAQGNLMVGTRTFTNLPSNLHTLIPNPYAAPLSPAALLATNTGFRGKIWVWDPKLAPTGGYVVYDALTGYSNTTGSYTSGTQIQLGQAFMVRPETAGATFTIQESHKGTNVNNNVLARQAQLSTNEVGILRVSLHKQEQQAWYPNDAVLVAFYEGGNNAVDMQDGTKLSKPGENIGIRRNTSNLTVEHRAMLSVTDTIPLRLTGMLAQQTHRLRVQTEMLEGAMLQGRLQDVTTGQEEVFDLDGSVFEYTFTTGASSGLQDRFRIVFEEQPLSHGTPERSPIQLWPNPVKDGVIYLRSSTAEKTWQGRITNIHGQIVQDFQISLSHEAQALDLSSALSEGVYFVRLEDEKGMRYTHKIVISN